MWHMATNCLPIRATHNRLNQLRFPVSMSALCRRDTPDFLVALVLAPRSIEGFDRVPGPPDAPIPPITPWTRVLGPTPMYVETRARSRKVTSTLSWEIPATGL